MKNIAFLLILSLAAFSAPALAQVAPVEAVPLAPIEVKPVPQAQPVGGAAQDTPPAIAAPTPITPGNAALDTPAQSDPQTTPYRPAFSAPAAPPQGREIGGSVPDQAAQGTTFCTLYVKFGGPRPDAALGQSVRTWLDGNNARASYKIFTKRGGGIDYCVDVTEHKDNAGIYRGLKKLLDEASGSSDTALSGEGFLTVTAK